MPGRTHLDQTVAQELRVIMGDEFPLLVQTFIRDSAHRIESIRDAIKAADADGLRRAAHSFKGSAGNMGAVPLAELCRQLEGLGRDAELTAAPTIIEQILDEYSAVERELLAMLRS
jgi:HPt (histidine-containing phosphotransfer) domain-containing protein